MLHGLVWFDMLCVVSSDVLYSVTAVAYAACYLRSDNLPSPPSLGHPAPPPIPPHSHSQGWIKR